MDMTAALGAVDSWPVDERLEFVQKVWDRIVDSGWQPTLTEDQKAEFDRRLDALDANPNDVITWEAITEHVRRDR